VAKEAINLLKQLGVPVEGMFANPANIPQDVETQSQQESSFDLQQVVVAGIPFYLDHEKKTAIPRQPINSQEQGKEPVSRMATKEGSSLSPIIRGKKSF
jgi:hypothetical protein